MKVSSSLKLQTINLEMHGFVDFVRTTILNLSVYVIILFEGINYKSWRFKIIFFPRKCYFSTNTWIRSDRGMYETEFTKKVTTDFSVKWWTVTVILELTFTQIELNNVKFNSNSSRTHRFSVLGCPDNFYHSAWTRQVVIKRMDPLSKNRCMKDSALDDANIFKKALQVNYSSMVSLLVRNDR